MRRMRRQLRTSLLQGGLRVNPQGTRRALPAFRELCRYVHTHAGLFENGPAAYFIAGAGPPQPYTGRTFRSIALLAFIKVAALDMSPTLS